MSNYFDFATILYVEDEEGTREVTSKALNRYAKELYVAKNGEEGLVLYKEYKPDIVVTDIKMPKMSGIDMSKAIKDINPDQAIIVTTAHSESAYFLEAIELQLSGYILKPVDKNLLKKKIVEIVKNLQRDKEFEKNKFLMQEIANLQNNIIVVYNKFYKIIFANKMFMDLFMVRSIEEFEQKYASLENTFIQHNDFYFSKSKNTQHWLKEIENYSDKKRIVSIIDHQDISAKSFLVNIKHISSSKHKICTFTEITNMIIEKKELEKKAFIDELTKIANRAKFNQVLESEIQKYKRYNENISLVMFDIDFFKNINDSFGHQVGDLILSSLSKLVSSNIRNVDFLARWGGEEFVILLPNTDLKSAISFTQNLRESIQQFIFEKDLKITCSFGVSEINEKDSGEKLLKRVDDALYRAKKLGRNRVESL